MATILYDSYEIKDAIVKIFSSPQRRRIAIVAFVGMDIERYFPNLSGLELICWPKPGSTNPSAIRKLMSSGVEVFFADNLHMKVYWAQGQGAVITSANLSATALGGRQYEIGVFLTPNEFDENKIDRILSSIKKRPVEEQEFREFERLHTLTERMSRLKIPEAKKLFDTPESRTPPSFSDWHEWPFRKNWKLAAIIPDNIPLSRKAKELLKEYGVEDAERCVSINSPDFTKGDWGLFFPIKRESLDSPFWFYVDDIVQVFPDEPAFKHGAFQIIQVGSNAPAELPFQISEGFELKLLKVIKNMGGDKRFIEWINDLELASPPKSFIDAIFDQYSSQ